MTKFYATPTPQDRESQVIRGDVSAAVLANTVIASENATVSSVITFNDNTTTIEVAAIGAPAVLKWIAKTDTQASVISAFGTSNFDNVVPINMVKKFVIPRETQGVSSIVGRNVQEGLYNRVAYKSIGTGSVLLTQYN